MWWINFKRTLKKKKRQLKTWQATWEDARSEIIDNTAQVEEVTSAYNTGHCEQIQQNQRTGLKMMEVSHQKTSERPHKTRHLIQLLNKKILDEHELKKDLRVTTKNLKKATKSARQKF